MSILRGVKSDLFEMCHGKCAYCESSLGLTYGGDIDNFRPKGGARGLDRSDYAPSHYWWLAYEWENLLLSCQICNQKYKRDLFPLENEKNRAPIGAQGAELLAEGALLLDPSLDEPSEHLVFASDGTVEGITPKGEASVAILGLNREELIRSRQRVIAQLQDSLALISGSNDLRNKFTRDFLDYVGEIYSNDSRREYLAAQRDVFDAWCTANRKLWAAITKANRFNTEEIPHKREASAEGNTWLSDKISDIKRFSIKTIEIENFRNIEKLTLEVQAPEEDAGREPWLLLLGDNGVGKSSILQALALALTPRDQLSKFGDVSDYLKSGTDHGSVVVHGFEKDSPITLKFDASGFESNLADPPTFLLGYGSTRLLPKGAIKPTEKFEPYLNIENLFDYSVALRDPNRWLSLIDQREFNERVAPAFFDILALEGEDHLTFEKNRIRIRHHSHESDLEHTSDGYKTIVALVCDIMQTLSFERANFHNSQGIVLIDEIGNHLHPRWRMKIVSSLRRAFPNLQFIVTTHEPLCLRGLSYGEVAVLVRDEQDRVRVLDKKMLPDHTLLRIDQLLTSDHFGLVNIFDEATEKKYEDYYRLLSKSETERTVADRRLISEYSKSLSEKESLGSTPMMQAVFKALNEEYVQKIRKEGFGIENLKDETVAEVKNLLKRKGWE